MVDIPEEVKALADSFERDWPYAMTISERRMTEHAIRHVLAARATRAARTEGVGVTVKVLEWQERPWALAKCIASSAVGDYFIEVGPSGGVTWRVMGGLANKVADVETAKAAAQADYEQRIRSALDTPNPDEARRQAAEIAELRSALGDLVSWFDGGPSSYGPWIIIAGDGGADAAVEAARAALRDQTEEEAEHGVR